MPTSPGLPTRTDIQSAIQTVRGQRVVMANDLAAFYGKSVSAFNQAVTRNEALFVGYRFQLTDAEMRGLESQNVIPKPAGRGGRRVNTWAYSDYGIVIASTLFRDARAIQITRMITEAFVDAAHSVVAQRTQIAEVLPPEDQPSALLPDGERLRALAERIVDNGQRSIVDMIATPSTKRQIAVATVMKSLAETSVLETQREQQQLRLSIARRLEAGDYSDDSDRQTLLDLLAALKA